MSPNIIRRLQNVAGNKLTNRDREALENDPEGFKNSEAGRRFFNLPEVDKELKNIEKESQEDRQKPYPYPPQTERPPGMYSRTERYSVEEDNWLSDLSSQEQKDITDALQLPANSSQLEKQEAIKNLSGQDLAGIMKKLSWDKKRRLFKTLDPNKKQQAFHHLPEDEQEDILETLDPEQGAWLKSYPDQLAFLQQKTKEISPAINALQKLGSQLNEPTNIEVVKKSPAIEALLKLGSQLSEPTSPSAEKKSPEAIDSLQKLGSQLNEPTSPGAEKKSPAIEALLKLGSQLNEPTSPSAEKKSPEAIDSLQKLGSQLNEPTSPGAEKKSPAIEALLKLGSQLNEPTSPSAEKKSPEAIDSLQKLGSQLNEPTSPGAEKKSPTIEALLKLGSQLNNSSTVHPSESAAGRSIIETLLKLGEQLNAPPQGDLFLKKALDLPLLNSKSKIELMSSSPKSQIITSPENLGSQLNETETPILKKPLVVDNFAEKIISPSAPSGSSAIEALLKLGEQLK